MTQSLDRGLDLLEALAERGEARLADLVEAVGGSRATVFRMLVALESRDFVSHDRHEHVYRLGPALTTLASRADSSSLIQVAAPAMVELRALTGETVNLAVVRRGRVVWGASIDGVSAIRLATTIGQEVPVHCTAAGKAILAATPNERWARWLGPEPYPTFTERTITSLGKLEKDVGLTASRGYAIDDGENELGGVCLAAAVVGRDGLPVGAISVTGIAQRLPVKVRPSVGRAVRAACEGVSSQLAGRSADSSRRPSAPGDATVTSLGARRKTR